MDKQKQIEEMANIIFDSRYKNDYISPLKGANELYNAGYRKESETAEKFAEMLKKKAWAFNTDENGNIWEYSIMKSSIDEIVNEITEGKI